MPKRATIVELIGFICLIGTVASVWYILQAAQLLNRHGKLSWLELLGIPLVCFAISGASGYWTIVSNAEVGRWSTVLRMICYVMTPFVLIFSVGMMLTEASRFTDGVAYWVGISIPCFWLGLPLAIFGGLLGLNRSMGSPRTVPLVLIGIVLFGAQVSFILSGVFSCVRQLAADAFTFLFSW